MRLLVERSGECPPPPPFLEIPHCKTPQRVAKVVKRQANGMKLAKVDRELAFLDQPATRNEMVVKIGAPLLIRGVRPEEQVGVRDLQGYALKKLVDVQQL